VGKVGIYSGPKEEKTLLTNSPNSSPSSPNIKKEEELLLLYIFTGSG
jgi:hypothetical protein